MGQTVAGTNGSWEKSPTPKDSKEVQRFKFTNSKENRELNVDFLMGHDGGANPKHYNEMHITFTDA
jgi:hypothetical protein